MNFQAQLDNLKKLALPQHQFVVVSSGAMAVRGIRDSLDLDVVVTQELWNELIKTYKVELNGLGVETLKLEGDIEILNPAQSLFGDSGPVSVKEIFAKADVFDGIKFVNLEHLKKVKLQMGREKDIKDVKLIEDYLVK